MNNRILIIDDEEDICFLLCNILQKKNMEVFLAHTLQDGLYKLSLNKPYLLFLDINLPDGSGLNAITAIKEQYPLIKIIIISAYDGLKERSQAEATGIDVFIGKPFSKEIICNTIKQLAPINPQIS